MAPEGNGAGGYRSGPGLARAIGVLAISLLPVLGCRAPTPQGDPNLVLEIGISPTPPAVGPARLLLTLRDSLGAPVEGAEIRVEGNMSHAGMAPVLDSALAQGSGSYVVPAFNFTMAGDWILTVRAALPDGRGTWAEKRTRVVAPPPGLDTGRAGGHGGGPAPPLPGQHRDHGRSVEGL